jgi:hypothetical protein
MGRLVRLVINIKRTGPADNRVNEYRALKNPKSPKGHCRTSADDLMRAMDAGRDKS